MSQTPTSKRSWWQVDPSSAPPRRPADPETQALSLTDELFGLDHADNDNDGDSDSDSEKHSSDRTVQMPRADQRHEER